MSYEVRRYCAVEKTWFTRPELEDGEGTAAYPTTSSRPPARGSPWLLSECLGAGSTVAALQELMNKGSTPGQVSYGLQQTQALAMDGTQ